MKVITDHPTKERFWKPFFNRFYRKGVTDPDVSFEYYWEVNTMKTFETLYSRKLIRNFNGESITEAELKEILEAAYAAPVGSAMYDTLSLTVQQNLISAVGVVFLQSIKNQIRP